MTLNLPSGHNPHIFIHFFWVDLFWHPFPLFFFFNFLHFLLLSLSLQVDFLSIVIWFIELSVSKFSDESSLDKTPFIPLLSWSSALILSFSALVCFNSSLSLATSTWTEPEIYQKYQNQQLLVYFCFLVHKQVLQQRHLNSFNIEFRKILKQFFAFNCRLANVWSPRYIKMANRSKRVHKILYGL